MTPKRLLLVTALSTGTLIPAAPAYALFPSVCVPRVQNCWCTYLKPCPVNDLTGNAVKKANNDELKDAKKVTKEHTTYLRDKALSMGADLSGLTPGLDAFGFDFSSMLTADINKITGALENAANQLKSIPITATELLDSAKGALDPQNITNAFKEMSLEVVDLEKMGLSQSTINGVLNGQLSTDQILEIANKTGLSGQVLKSAGVTPEIITAISNGEISVSAAQQSIINKSGLTINDLSKLGLDTQALNDIAGLADQGKLKSLVGQLGIDDLQTVSSFVRIKGIVEGDFDASDVFALASAAGYSVDDLIENGVSQSTLNAFTNGAFSADQLIEITKHIGATGDALKALGIDEATIIALSKGQISPEAVLNIAQKQGLSFDTLSSVGLGPEKLAEIASTRDLTLALTAMDNAGLAVNPLKGAGLSTAQLAGYLKGTVSIDEIATTLVANGIDPITVILPTKDGNAINALGQFVANPRTTFTVSISDISGLNDALAQSIFGETANATVSASYIHTAISANTGIDISTVEFIEKVIAGEVKSSDVLKLLEDSGLSQEDLRRLQVQDETLQAMMNDSFSAEQILNFARNIGIGQQTLEAMGIGLETLEKVQNGELSIDDYYNLAERVGLDAGKLENYGITKEIIKNIATGKASISATDAFAMTSANAEGPIQSQIYEIISGETGLDMKDVTFMDKLIKGEINSSDIMEVLERNGIDSATYTALGVPQDTIDAFGSGNFTASQLITMSRQLGLGTQALDALGFGIKSFEKIQAGQLSIDDYYSMAEAVGLNSEYLEQYGITRDLLSQIGTQTGLVAPQEVANLLGGSSASDIQIPVSDDSPFAPIAEISEPHALGDTCSNDQTLILSDSPPNPYGSDVADIDMNISSGSLENHGAAVAKARERAATNQAQVLAKSIVTKNIIVEALDNIAYYESMIKSTGLPIEDKRLVGEMQKQLIMARAEVASLMTFLASSKASSKINTTYFTPVPTFPHDSKWEAVVKAEAEQRANDIKQKAEAAEATGRVYTNYIYESARVLEGFEALNSYNSMAETIAPVTQEILNHEEMKRHKFMLRAMIEASANEIFHDGDAAAAKILSYLDMKSDEYGPESRWHQSNDIARSLDSAVVGYPSSYGDRKLQSMGRRDEPPVPVPPTPRPYNYGTIDSFSENDPYDIDRSYTGGHGDDPLVRPPLAGLFQYYMEANRREKYFGELRRGTPPDTMSLRAWEELKYSDISCLIGPIESTLENVEAKPELFDLSPYCSHLTFSGGDAEDFIPSSDFGGADAILWETKIRMDVITQGFGGEANIYAAGEEYLTYLESDDFLSDMKQHGNPGWLENIEETKAILRENIAHNEATK